MLRPFADGVWIADGPVVRFLGWFPYPTRMAIVRLADGGLWVWSPIPLDDALAAEVDAFGPVRHLVPPNKLHHLFLAPWTARHPCAALWAPPGLPTKRPDLTFAGELDDTAPAAWAGQIDQVVFRGSAFMEEVVFFHRTSRVALVCDLIQRFERERLTGVRRWVMQAWGLVGERGSTPREWRASFLRRGPARAAKRTVLGWNPQGLVIAHGMCATTNAGAVLEDGLRWLG